MNVLWLVNVKIPLVYTISGEKNKTNVGGWLDQISKRFTNNSENQLCVVYPTANKNGETGQKINVKYFGIYFDQHKMNAGKLSDESVNQFVSILLEQNPDVIHIHGTEFQHSYFMTEAAKRCGMIERVVISIQGMVGYYAKHFDLGIPQKIKRRRTIREIVLNRDIETAKREYVQRGVFEKLAIENVKYVIGRTNWDLACVKLINPQIEYYFCNETLRSDFYSEEWSYEKCEKHSVFVSQASYPIKGAHLLIEAVSLVKKRFPDVKIRIAGPSLLGGNWIKGNSYSLYIQELIKRNDLNDNIIFLGSQNAQQMKENMLNANVFVSPSTIENSPNSLGEAMILAVPCVSSDVGGVMNLMCHNKEGYIYPVDETYMLAYYLIDLFENKEKAIEMGKMAKSHAMITHDLDTNYSRLVGIYGEIIGG